MMSPRIELFVQMISYDYKLRCLLLLYSFKFPSSAHIRRIDYLLLLTWKSTIEICFDRHITRLPVSSDDYFTMLRLSTF